MCGRGGRGGGVEQQAQGVEQFGVQCGPRIDLTQLQFQRVVAAELAAACVVCGGCEIGPGQALQGLQKDHAGFA